MTTGDDVESDSETAVILDVLQRGRPDDDRPAYEKSPIAYALTESSFRLLEVTLSDDTRLNIGDRIAVDPPGEPVQRSRSIDFETLSSAAESELEYAIEAIIDEDEARFVGFYNDAQPITTRLHVLNLLPGIGKKLRNDILEERKRDPFDSFEEIESRISGLHRPKEVLVERIIEEIKEDDLKYRIFAKRAE
ncbi:MAG: DUF655 domain-containing protein [Natronomonas sp.]